VRRPGYGRRGPALAAALALAALGIGCRETPKPGLTSTAPRPAPNFEKVCEVVNARAAKLRRVWARAVTSFTWKDAEGKGHWEQGEGFFQLVQPSRFALDIGKLGEVIIWAGCDDDFYWLIRRGEDKTARIGAHDGPGSEQLLREGLPATPLELIELAGVTPISTDRPPVATGWTESGLWVVVTAVENGSVRREIDPVSGEPRRIVLRSKGWDRVESVLTEPAPVELDGTSDWPRMATRMTVTDLSNGNKLVVSIEAMSDGIRGRSPGKERLKPENFDFDVLRERLGVKRVIDLDEGAEAK